MTVYTVERFEKAYKVIKNKKVVLRTNSMNEVEEYIFGKMAELEKLGCSYKIQNRTKELSF